MLTAAFPRLSAEDEAQTRQRVPYRVKKTLTATI
jgi:hypothetical protein